MTITDGDEDRPGKRGADRSPPGSRNSSPSPSRCGRRKGSGRRALMEPRQRRIDAVVQVDRIGRRRQYHGRHRGMIKNVMMNPRLRRRRRRTRRRRRRRRSRREVVVSSGCVGGGVRQQNPVLLLVLGGSGGRGSVSRLMLLMMMVRLSVRCSRRRRWKR